MGTRLSFRFGGSSSPLPGPCGYVSMSWYHRGKDRKSLGVCGGVSGSPEPGSPERSCDNRYGSRVVHLLWCPGDLSLNPATGYGCLQVANKAPSTESGA